MITIKNDFLTVQISPMGGELQSVKDRTGREYLWQGDPAFWSGRAPNLFPYCGRLTDGKCTYRGREYPLPKHGFVRHRKMIAEKVSESSCTFLLRSDEETLALFPFEFAFRVTYELEGSSLFCRYHVTNFSDFTMYFGLGAHPAFAVPADKFDKYSVKFSSDVPPKRVHMSEDNFVLPQRTPYPLENGVMPLAGYPFENSIVFTDMPKSAALLDEAGRSVVTVDYDDFDYLLLWRAPQAPFFCIEPWCSLPSRKDVVEELSTQPSLIVLEEGDFKAALRIRFGE